MSKHFITFGGGEIKYINAGNRLINQANETKFFDCVELYGIQHLKQDAEFVKKHQDFITKNKRGFGYWLWKPYIIKKKMEKMKDGDILFYLDAGCEIDVKKKKLLEKCFKIIKDDKIIGSTCGPEKTGHLEKNWTKMDLILKLGANESKYIDTVQRQGGTNMFYVCDEMRKLVDEWYNISCCYDLINDSKSKTANYPTFREHRHDQSIFSLLTKKHGIFSKLSLYQCGIVIERNFSFHSNIGKKPIMKKPKMKMNFFL